ncbi:ComF family protein [Candidatus Poriferisodalis sp.]|uniref:ComF family protein n=1 Tax=Candidatus Poriferisodalis sp. TaxID=3101277 RepID=UPI003B5B3E6E
MLFEVRCPGCHALGWCPCAECIGALSDPEPASVPGAESVALLFSHDGVGREFIHALKYRGERAIARWLGESLALAHLAAPSQGSIDTAAALPARIDTVTWAPTTAAHRRSRGFDQAETLARTTAKALRVRPARLLRRIGTRAQSGASRTERLHGPRFNARVRVAGRRILLVDDVLTTGATLRAATAALLDARAASVHVAACARRGHDGAASVA